MSLRKLHTRLAAVLPAPSMAIHAADVLPAFLKPDDVEDRSQLELDLMPATQNVHGEFLRACPHPNILDTIKWRFTRETTQLPRDPEVLNSTLPVLTPDFETPIPNQHARITWLGHASVLLEVPLGDLNDKMTILTDAVFSDRCSPSQFFGPVRYRPCPVEAEMLPHIDAVLISHNHYDHLDLITLEKLHRVQPHLRWFIPLNNSKYLTSVGIPIDQIHEQNWWDSHPLTKNGQTFQVSCVPAKHWSKRFFNDTNKSLWGGWVVQGLGGSFYFVGDTACDTFFRAIHHKYGEQSISAIPIGAYAPRKLFTDQHVNVQEAVRIHNDVKSRSSVGIHWGTWELTDEFYLEPREELAKHMEHDPSSFFTLDHGEQKILLWTL